MTGALLVLAASLGQATPPGPADSLPDVPALSVAPTAAPGRYGNPTPRLASDRPLRLSFSGFADFYDHFRLADDPDASEVRVGVALGADYQHVAERSSASLRTVVSMSHDIRADTWNYGYGNLSGSLTRRADRRTFTLVDTMQYGDDPGEVSTLTYGGSREPYFRNTFVPTWSFQLASRTRLSIGYSNSLTWTDQDDIDAGMTHTAQIGIGRQFSESWSGNLGYEFRAEDRESGFELTNSVTGGLRKRIDTRTAASLEVEGWLYGGESREPQNWRTEARLTFDRLIAKGLTAQLGGGVSVLGEPGGGVRVRPLWIAGLDGALNVPLMRSERTTLRITGGQTVEDTSDEVRDQGLILHQHAGLDVQHLLGPRSTFRAAARYRRSESFFGDSEASDQEFVNDESLEATGSLGFPLGRYWFTGLSYSYTYWFANGPGQPPSDQRASFVIGRSFWLF